MSKIQSRDKRRKRVRSKVFGFPEKPRISVFRSNSHLYVQLIDDEKGHTLVSVSDTELGKEAKGKKTEIASLVGELLAQKAVKAKIKNAVFDKNGYKYHGVVKAVADGARKGGLVF